MRQYIKYKQGECPSMTNRTIKRGNKQIKLFKTLFMTEYFPTLKCNNLESFPNFCITPSCVLQILIGPVYKNEGVYHRINSIIKRFVKIN
jgi:hypothetical protein